MTPRHSPRAALLGLVLLAATLAAPAAASQTADAPPPLPADTLAHPVELLHAWPFTLDQPEVHASRAERPTYAAGMVLVLGVRDPALVHPRQGPMPVLYVGAQTAARLNAGHESGRLLVVVPAPLDESGRVALDLARTPIFFGSPGLPEQVDAAVVDGQLAVARERGVAPPGADAVAAALHAPLRFPDLGDLHAWAADVLAEVSPQEVDLIAGLRAPRLRR